MPLDPELIEAAKQLQHRRLLRTDFEAFCRHILAPLGQEPAPHHLVLIKALQELADTPNGRLMIFMPPSHAKSTYASVLFPAWFFSRKTNQNIIGASYNADLAERFSTFVRRIIEDHGPELGYNLRKDSTSRERWETDHGCEYRAVGMNAGITGNRADLFMIDDPVRSLEDAYSPTVSEKVWDVYRTDVISRPKKGGRICVIMTRWAENDLAGRILEAEGTIDDGQERPEYKRFQPRSPYPWRVVRLPAIAEKDDPLGRKPGEALWPSDHPIEELENIRRVMGEREFSALYQGLPQPADGNLFKVQAIGHTVAIPTEGIVSTVRAYDLAASNNARSDYTVGVKLAKLADGSFAVLDVIRFRGEPQDVEKMILATAKQDGVGTKISLPQDPGQAGKSQMLYLTKALAGYHVESSRETGDKVTRAMPVISQTNVGNLTIVDAPWNAHFLLELSSFPGGKHDDQVDALSRAFNALIQPSKPAQFVRLPFMAR